MTIPNFDWAVFKTLKPGDHLYRGERNNNPGNLVNTPETWKGEIVDGDDPKFMQFTTAVLGIRALAKLLITYQNKYGLSTIESLITRWAPPNENDTEEYIQDVCEEAGVTRSEKVDVKAKMYGLMTSIIRKECTRVAYKIEVIQAGITLAMVDSGMAAIEPKDERPDPLRDYKTMVMFKKSAGGGGLNIGILLLHNDLAKTAILPAADLFLVPSGIEILD